jgi:hypothetical protein
MQGVCLSLHESSVCSLSQTLQKQDFSSLTNAVPGIPFGPGISEPHENTVRLVTISNMEFGPSC